MKLMQSAMHHVHAQCKRLDFDVQGPQCRMNPQTVMMDASLVGVEQDKAMLKMKRPKRN